MKKIYIYEQKIKKNQMILHNNNNIFISKL